MIRAVTALLYLAERRIEEAIARGEFDDLAGAGRSLDSTPASRRPRPTRPSGAPRRARCSRASYFAFASCSEMARFKSLYSLQPKKHSLSSAPRCSFALATLPTIR